MSISKLVSVPKRLRDPFVPLFYTRFDFIVPAPSASATDLRPCILVSIRHGHRKLFCRCDLAGIEAVFRLTDSERARLSDALAEARRQAAAIIAAQSQEAATRRLPELPDDGVMDGYEVVDTIAGISL